jgi:hypothetical protein
MHPDSPASAMDTIAASRNEPGRVNSEALREELRHTCGTTQFSLENFSRFPPIAVPRAGLEPAQSDRKPFAGQVVATYRFVFIQCEFRLGPSGTVPFHPKPRSHGTCMAQNAGAPSVGFDRNRQESCSLSDLHGFSGHLRVTILIVPSPVLATFSIHRPRTVSRRLWCY